jgi:hypothetical protein
MGHTILYFPILILTVLLMATGLALPSEIRVNETTVPPYAEFGILSPLFMAGGILYIACTIILLIWMLKSGAGQLKKELLMILGVILLALGTAFLLILFYHDISFSAVYSIIGSLLGLILGNAALKRSTLIVPQKETRTVERPVELLRPGATYLFLGDKKNQARELFALFLKDGREGLWITRKHPCEAREMYGIVKTPFIWLTGAREDGEVCIDPRELGILSRSVMGFIGNAKDYVILIEGLEYLYSCNGFESVLRLIQFLNDRVMTTKGILMMGMSPAAFKENEVALLKSEAAQVFEEAGITVQGRNLGAPMPLGGSA